MNSELVLNAAHFQFGAFFTDEHGKTASVRGPFHGTGKHQMNLGTAVRDEPFHSVQMPFPVLILSGFETDGLEVGTGIRLGEVHRSVRFARGKPGKIFLFLFFRTEFIDRFRNILEPDQVLQRSIGTCDHFGHHRVDRGREIESAVLTRKQNAHDSGILEILQVLIGQRMIFDNAVLEGRTFFIHLSGAGGDPFAGDLSDFGQDTRIVILRIFEIFRGVIIFFRLFVLILAESDKLLHVDVLKREHQVGIIFEKV